MTLRDLYPDIAASMDEVNRARDAERTVTVVSHDCEHGTFDVVIDGWPTTVSEARMIQFNDEGVTIVVDGKKVG